MPFTAHEHRCRRPGRPGFGGGGAGSKPDDQSHLRSDGRWRAALFGSFPDAGSLQIVGTASGMPVAQTVVFGL